MNRPTLTRRVMLTGALAGAAAPAYAQKAATPAKRVAGTGEWNVYERFFRPGPFPVKVANPLSFTMPDQKKDLLVRVTYPDPSAPSDGRHFPVILFSHGALSSKDLYTRVVDHWASHGFVIVQPTHLDSESLNYKMGSLDSTALVFSRVGDLKFLLDHLDDIAAQSPALSGRLAKDQVATAGHSFGAEIALALAGLGLKQKNGAVVNVGDPRVKAVVTYNGIGPVPNASDDWTTVTLPVFASTGTNDPSNTGSGELRSWRWRMGGYDLTAGKERYGVSIAGGDHYYGGLICREGTGKPDPDGLAVTNAMSTAFLSGYLNNDANARALLQKADLPKLSNERGFLESTI